MAKTTVKKPTLTELDDRVTYATNLHSQRVKQQETWQSIIMLENKPTQPEEGVETVQLPSPYNAVDTAKGALTSNQILIRVLADEENEDARRNAEHQERIGMGLWQASEYQQGVELTGDVLWYGAATGWIVIRVLFDPEAPEGYSPIQIEALDPKSVFPVPGRYGWSYVVERTKHIGAELIDAFPKEHLKSNEEYEVTEYWDKTFRAIQLNGRWILPPTPHDYGFIPYIIGFGKKTPRNQTTEGLSSKVVTRWGWSIVAPAESIYEKQNKLLGAVHTSLVTYANPSFIYKTAQPNGPGGKQFEKMSPGEIYEIERDEEFGPADAGRIPPDMSFLMGIYDRAEQKSTFPDVISGVDIGDVSGYLGSVLQRGPMVKLADLVFGAQFTIAAGIRCALVLFGKFGKKTDFLVKKSDIQSIGKVIAKPSDIPKTPPTVFVQIKPALPSDDAARAATAKMWVEAGMDKATAMERFGDVQDVIAMHDRWMAEKAEELPEVMKVKMYIGLMTQLYGPPQSPQEAEQRKQMVLDAFIRATGLQAPGTSVPTQPVAPAPYTDNPNPTGMAPQFASPETLGVPEQNPATQIINSPEQLLGPGGL